MFPTAEPKLLRFPTVRVGAAPGGLPPHFRVQVYDDRTMTWRLHAMFTYQDEAQTAAERLIEQSQACRVVDYRCCATAG